MPTYVSSTRHIDRALSNFALAYANKELVGLKFMPEIACEKPSDKYFKRSKANSLTAMDGKMSATGNPAEIETNATTSNFSCEDYGFTAKVAGRDEAEADVPLTLRQDATLDAVASLRLAQEIRIAAIVGVSTSYSSANRVTLSGADQWDSSGGGDPLGVIDQYRATIWRGPNTRLVAGCDEKTWRVLKRHPAVIDLVKGGANSSTPAVVMKQLFAELIEVDEFVVGEAWKNTANPAAADSYSRVWPKAFWINAVANAPSTRSLHFGSTFRWQDVETSAEYDAKPGLKGVWWFKCAHSVDEVVCADDAGCFIGTPVS